MALKVQCLYCRTTISVAENLRKDDSLSVLPGNDEGSRRQTGDATAGPTAAVPGTTPTTGAATAAGAESDGICRPSSGCGDGGSRTNGPAAGHAHAAAADSR